MMMTYAVQDGIVTELDLGMPGTYSAQWSGYGTDWVVVMAESSDAAKIASLEYDAGRRLTTDELIALDSMLDVHAGRGIVQDSAVAHAELDRIGVEVTS
jgi:hypothetical protein